jgi:hypothetical protein
MVVAMVGVNHRGDIQLCSQQWWDLRVKILRSIRINGRIVRKLFRV